MIIIQYTQRGDLIASDPLLAEADIFLDMKGREYYLKEALDGIKEEYDFVIIDTPPALGILTVNAMTASTGILIPGQADILSIQGISLIYNTAQNVRKISNPQLCIYGIVLVRYNPRTIISQDLTEALEQIADQMDTRLFNFKIRKCTAIKEAQAQRESIFSYDKKCNAVTDYEGVLKELLKVIKNGKKEK